MNVKAYLSRTPPDTLYHYTTQAGLLGILRNKEIWATHTNYLNDQLEFRHALDVIQEELQVMKRLPTNGDRLELLEKMEEGVARSDSMNVCVCSFSEEGDVLSQWRAYGGDCGFSVGFSGPFLRAVCDQEHFWLVRCIYDDREQHAFMRTLLEDVLEENIVRRDAGKDRKHLPPGGSLVAYLNRYAPILKHKSFSEEREWRIISKPLACSFERFDYRPGKSMLVPYYRVPLATETASFGIEEVIVGPTPHQGPALMAARGLLVRYDLEDVKLRNTIAPYRNW